MMNIGAHIVVWWMALLMIALPMVPHHHHQGTVCVVMERCQSDGAINDQHTHHQSDENPRHQDQCVKTFKAVPAIDPDHSDVNEVPLCTLLYAFVEQWMAEVHQATAKQIDTYTIHYQSVDTRLSNTLRAPPQMLSSDRL